MTMTEETRNESYKLILGNNKSKRRRMIIDAFLDNVELTARQCVKLLGFSDMNQVRPRISEMLKDGTLEEAGFAIDVLTKRKVVVYRLSEEYLQAEINEMKEKRLKTTMKTVLSQTKKYNKIKNTN